MRRKRRQDSLESMIVVLATAGYILSFENPEGFYFSAVVICSVMKRICLPDLI